MPVYKGTANTVSSIKDYDADALDPSAKIKLQFFPINEGTRIGLEQDGHCPYLELALRSRKRMNSVVKHLSNKWGSSKIARGVLALFPYNREANASSCCRQESVDLDVCAGSLYASMDCPSSFRLRYGWVSDLDTEAHETPLVCKSEDASRGHDIASSNKKEIVATCQESFSAEKGLGTVLQLDTPLETSILDADETCHAFSYKLYPSRKESLNSSNDDTSLGLTGIKWNDSLGPFDLGICPARRFTGGETIS